MGHPVCWLLEGDHPSVPAGCFEVSICPGSEPHGTQSHNVSVLNWGLVPQGRRLGPVKGPTREQAGCWHLLGRLPGEVWIRLVWLV